MSIKKIFKSSFPHLVYVTKGGKHLMFQNYKHITDNAFDIKELEDEIKSQHPHISVDPDETHIDTTLQDKIAEAQRAAALAVMAEHAGLTAKAGDAAVGYVEGTLITGQQPTAAQTMSVASLMNITSSASLSGLASPSTQK